MNYIFINHLSYATTTIFLAVDTFREFDLKLNIGLKGVSPTLPSKLDFIDRPVVLRKTGHKFPLNSW